MKKIKELYLRHEEIINYIIVGVLTTLVSWAAYALCRLVLNVNGNQLHMQIAVFIRWIAGVIFAYFTNRKYVFKSDNPNKIKEFIGFASSRVATYILDALIMAFLPGLLPEKVFVITNDWAATLISAVVVTIMNYILSKFLVFKKEKNV